MIGLGFHGGNHGFQRDLVQGPLLHPFLPPKVLTLKGSLPPLMGSSPSRAPPLLLEGPLSSLGGHFHLQGVRCIWVVCCCL